MSPQPPSGPTFADIEYRWNRESIAAFIASAEVARTALGDVPELIRMVKTLSAENAALRDIVAGQIPGWEPPPPDHR